MSKKLFIQLSLFFLGMLAMPCLHAQNDSATEKSQVQLQIPADSVPAAPIIKKKPKETIAIAKAADSVKPIVDSFQNSVKKDTIPGSISLAYGMAVDSFITRHPYYATGGAIVEMPSQYSNMPGKDELFYIACGVLIFLGILKVGFPKYFHDLFNLFWRSAFRQKQIRDQLQQAGMTTLLFNIFFVVSLALFAYLIIQYLQGAIINPLIMFAVCFFSIAFIYGVKFVILKLSGWMFGQEEAMDTYSFIVFMVNKILSILIIPFTLVLAFSDRSIQQVAFTASILLIAFLFIYRFIVAYIGIRNELKINALHLLLYVCGFEIIPVLLIYRLIVDLFERSS